jgi:dipeptidyl aminopeptidase/acylaminoacyl peptidase
MRISRAGNIVAFALADATGYHLCCLPVDAEGMLGTLPLFAQGKSPAICQALSYEGDIAVMGSTERTGTLRGSLVALDTASGQRIGMLWDGPESSLEAVGFAPVAPDLRLLARTNRTGVTRPLLWNLCTGERTDLALDELEGEVYPGGWSPEDTRLLLRQFNRAVEQLYVYDLERRTLTRLQPPSGTYGRTFFGPQGEILAEWQDSTHPVRLIALDGETGAQTRTILATDVVPVGRPWQSITFTSSDGQAIQGWLALPDGEGPFPAVLHMHGGPEDVMRDRFSPGAQAWLDHGFAFLTINYRGSVTFGRAFREQIWRNLGYWEVEDMIAARAWLIKRGIAWFGAGHGSLAVEQQIEHQERMLCFAYRVLS